MTIEVLRRTFAASKYPPGSEERARLNRDTLTSEYYTSHRYMTREPFTMDEGTPHPTQPYLCRTFTTKAEADAYVSRQRPPIVRVVKIDQVDMFADQAGLFGHVVQPGELE
jgi:hypothetical protein